MTKDQGDLFTFPQKSTCLSVKATHISKFRRITYRSIEGDGRTPSETTAQQTYKG